MLYWSLQAHSHGGLEATFAVTQEQSHSGWSPSFTPLFPPLSQADSEFWQILTYTAVTNASDFEAVHWRKLNPKDVIHMQKHLDFIIHFT